jgi:hypothetical protein
MRGDQTVHSGRPLGTFVHIALYRALAAASGSPDMIYGEQLMAGFPIIGPIERSGRWLERECKVLVPEPTLVDRAWDIRRTVINSVRNKPINANSMKIWEATVQDEKSNYTIGPFDSEEAVSNALGTEQWIPTERFAREQKNKVRGVDSATANDINPATAISEDLVLTSTDENVNVIMAWHREAAKQNRPSPKMWGWVLDEKDAYRQIGVSPVHRKYSVIVMKNPKTKKVNFWIMIGHSFGIVSAVYNYIRRSALINDFLRRTFKVLASFFYDDKFGFEPADSCKQAHGIVRDVHVWLGADFAEKKLQLRRDPGIL